MQDHLTLLDISFEDINASELLYKNNFFPHAIFYFQQSVEKAVKFIGLDAEVIKPGELQKNIGHKTLKIFNKAMEKYGLTNFNSELLKLQSQVKNSELNDIIPIVISQIKSINDDPVKLPFEHKNVSELTQIIEIIRQLNPENEEISIIQGFNDEVKQMFVAKAKRFLNNLPNYIKSVEIFLILSLLINNYVSLVRYPDEEFINPSLEYNSNNSLVSSLPFLQRTVHKGIKSILNNYLAKIH